MNGAPDWQDGECCFRCRTQFTLVARKHHCRNCGNIFCAKCSSQQIPLPKLNIDKNVRVCDTCFEKIATKNEDPLTLALSTTDTEQTKPKLASAHSNSKSSSSSNNKSAAGASAPSEQELKEEEEFQLALALSLSETPTKVSFPEVRNYEESKSSVNKNALPTQINSNNSNVTVNHSYMPDAISTQRVNPTQTETTVTLPLDYSAINQQQLPPPPPIDYYIPERDREVFRYVGEVQSTLEVFTNRLESCKLRNRPVANDAAIQSVFIRLNSEVQPKLAEYIKKFDEERADHERIQDKLSQISDARAALDALREEHQDKMRELAAEAERLRQTQLATKLEAMRQKKSQMMQYQRELALQRIKEQEMLTQQQQQYQPATTQGYHAPAVSAHQDTFVKPPISNDVIQDWHNNQQPQPQQHQLPESHYSQVQPANYVSTQQQYPPATTQSTHIPQHQHAAVPSTQPSIASSTQTPQPPSIDRVSIAHLERQFLPPSKPDEDTPLISFDD